MAKKNTEVGIQLNAPTRVHIDVCVIGTTPLLFNSYSDKAKLTLLMGGKKADKLKIKHNPFAEFRGSARQLADKKADTLLALPSTAFKPSLMTAALDVQDATKAGIGRQVYVHGYAVGVYGVPRPKMDMVRSADMGKTPDVRTRACVAEWCARLSISFVSPNLKEQSVLNLLVAAGMLAGVGDGRPEKGKLDYGQFEVCAANDKRFTSIVKSGGRAVQTRAMLDAEPFDHETAALLEAFTAELPQRGWKMQDGEIVAIQSDTKKTKKGA